MVYLAMALCDMDDVEAVPQQVDRLKSQDELVDFFHNLCKQVVRHVWLMPSITEVTAVIDSPVDSSFVADNWCICGQGMHAHLPH